jgi:hypothetical protein
MRRNAHFAFGRRHERRRILVEDLFAAQVLQKGAHRRELARRGRAREPWL